MQWIAAGRAGVLVAVLVCWGVLSALAALRRSRRRSRRYGSACGVNPPERISRANDHSLVVLGCRSWLSMGSLRRFVR